MMWIKGERTMNLIELFANKTLIYGFTILITLALTVFLEIGRAHV